MSQKKKRADLDPLNEDKTYVCFGFGCLNIGFMKQNLNGCSMSNECCCFLHECCCLISRDYLNCWNKAEGDHIRIGCGCDACTIKKPTICFKQQSHCLCLVCGCSLIPDADVPCVFACCSLVYSTVKCNVFCQNCLTFGEIK